MPTLTRDELVQDKKKAVEMLVALQEQLLEYQRAKADEPKSMMHQFRIKLGTDAGTKQKIIQTTLDEIAELIGPSDMTRGCKLGCVHSQRSSDDGKITAPARYEEGYDHRDKNGKTMCGKYGYEKKGSEYFAVDDFMLTPNVVNDTGNGKWTNESKTPSEVAQDLCNDVTQKLRAAGSTLVRDIPEQYDSDEELVAPGRPSLQTAVRSAANDFNIRHPQKSVVAKPTS